MTLALALIQRHYWVGGIAERGLFHGSHCSRPLVALLVQGSPSQVEGVSGLPPQTRQVLEILSLFMFPGGALVPAPVSRW